MQSTNESLIDELYRISSKTIILEFNVSKAKSIFKEDEETDKFVSFIFLFSKTSFRESFFEEYKELTSLIITVCRGWVNRIKVLFERLNHDFVRLVNNKLLDNQTVFKLTKYHEAGDKHDGLQAVTIIEFNDKLKVVYKPRELNHHVAFSDLIHYLNENYNFIYLRSPKILDMGVYGWCEFMDRQACKDKEELKLYYQRLGALQCIIFFLNGYDIHYENVIAHGDMPVIIDVECLFNPSLAKTGFKNELSESILTSCLLPFKLKINGSHFKLGASENINGQETLTKVPSITTLPDKGLSVIYKKEKISGAKNLPFTKDGDFDFFSFEDHFRKGFIDSFKVFIKDKVEIINYISRRFNNINFRVLFRHTFSYAHLLDESCHPDYLRSSIDRKGLFEHLKDIPESNPLYYLISYEEDLLLNHDVPSFYFNASHGHLKCNNNRVILKNFFNKDALQPVLSKIGEATELSLNFQLWLMDCITKSYHKENDLHEISYAAEERDIFLDSAKSIAKSAEAYSFCTEKRRVWLSSNRNNGLINEMGYDLYNGRLGVALFYGYLYKVFQEIKFKEISLGAVETKEIERVIADEGADSGLFTGIAGITYTFSHLYHIFKDKELLNLAQKSSEAFLSKVPALLEVDVIKGISGHILALKSLMNVVPESKNKYVSQIEFLADELVHRSVINDDQPRWVSNSLRVPLGGFSHGTSGIAVALNFAFSLTKNATYRDYVRHALNYEQTIFDAPSNNWLDMRQPNYKTDRTVQFSWCNGSVGIGLARLGLLNLEEAIWKRDLDVALESTIKRGFGDNHSLCHGDYGNLDLLYTASLLLNNKELKKKALAIAERTTHSLLKGGIRLGSKEQVINLGLMTGVIGVAYQLLRFSKPRAVPSILMLEPPQILEDI